MLETSARLLRLLSLLQMHRDWTGPQLADELEITPRTVRRDVDKLRSLGYPVNAAPGVAGGYRLGAGSELPPLLLDDDEAVAVAVGLRTAAGGSVVGIQESSLRALTKLEGVLPPQLRRRVGAVHAFTVPVPGMGPEVDPDVLSTIAGACRDRLQLRFGYGAGDGTASRRLVEPHRMVHVHGRWYLGVDLGPHPRYRHRERVDRITSKLLTGRRVPRRDPPDPDLAAYVMRNLRGAKDRYRARVVLHAPKAEVAPRIPPWAGELTARDDGTCLLEASASWLGGLAVYIATVGVDFTVLGPPEFADEVRRLGERFARASAPAG
jgi:predicted DNA-binding transcriptional regulator YafY